MIKVTVWNEFRHENLDKAVLDIYPKGIHGCIADFLGVHDDIQVRTATLDEPEHGLTDEVLEDTDVLIWWGHMAHHEVSDEIAKKVQNRVLRGMGFIALHSAHMSKPFMLLMGTCCTLNWRDGDFERVWNIAPNHPISQGIGEYFELDVEEMYGERFDIPTPDEIVFMGWFAGGEVFRSGCCWQRGLGKVFYFQPGHEYNPTFHQEPVQKIITNAVRWAAPYQIVDQVVAPCIIPSPEEIRKNRKA